MGGGGQGLGGLCPVLTEGDHCCVSLQARMAGERGASAVLFDITEDRAAAEQVLRDTGVFEGAGWREIKLPGERQVKTQQPLWVLFLLQLQQPLGLTWPVVLIWGKDAEKLMEFVYKNRKAHVRIELKEPPTWVSMPDLQPLPWHPFSPPFLPVATPIQSPYTPGAKENSEILTLHLHTPAVCFWTRFLPLWASSAE